MFRDVEKLLDYEISRKPELAVLNDRLDQISEEELRSMSFPLKWIKDAFLARRAKRLIEKAVAINIQEGMIFDTFSSDPSGTILIWTKVDDFIRTDRGGSISIKTGDYLFTPDRGGVFIDTLFSQTIDPSIRQSRVDRRATLSEYKTACSDARNRLIPTQTVELGSSSATAKLAQFGVRFR